MTGPPALRWLCPNRPVPLARPTFHGPANHVHALGHECAGHRQADPFARSGNYRSFTSQSKVHIAYGTKGLASRWSSTTTSG